MFEALDRMLASAGRGFHLERVERGRFDPELLRELHGLSNELMAEPLEQFLHHAETNDELHVFRRRATGEAEGFQFWRAFATGPEERVVLGGKLRIRPRARRSGLHLVSGLRVLLEQRRRFPEARVTRVGVVSLFGFVSIARRLAHYEFVEAHGPRADLVPLVARVTGDSGYRFDPDTGLVDVGIYVTNGQLETYPDRYFERAEARAYLARNPNFRTNGCYLAFAFPADAANLEALALGAAESTGGAKECAQELVRSPHDVE